MPGSYRPPDEVRCTFTYRDGRRCRMLRADGHQLGFCPYHIQQWLKQNDVEPPRNRSISAPGALDNPWAVRRSLKLVVRELAEGRFTPDQARALTSLGRLLLISTRRRPKRRRVARPSGCAQSRPANSAA